MSSSTSNSPQWNVRYIPYLPDHVLSWSTEIRLHCVQPENDIHSGDFIRISDNRVAELKSALPEPPHYLKCISVQPEGNPEGGGSVGNGADNESRIRFAAGQANGRISLLTFDRINRGAKEFR